MSVRYVNANAEGLMKSSNVEEWKTARVRVTFCLITTTYVFSIRYIHVKLHLPVILKLDVPI